jgi:hypothetical protein
MKKFFCLIFSLFFVSGCASNVRWESKAAKWLIPANIGIAYFGNLALHESSHALAVEGFGSSVHSMRFTPEIEGGNLYFGNIRFDSTNLSDTELTVINTMGPTSTYAGHVFMREMLKTGKMPPIIQPTMGWFSLFGKISYYYHVGNGLFRRKGTDLGKEPVWISIVMLSGGLIYDIYDLLFSDDTGNHIKVLFGEHFYEERPDTRFRLLMTPEKDGGFIGFRFDF